MVKIKKMLLFILCLCLSLTAGLPGSFADSSETSPPIAEGKTNRLTYIYWGKGEAFPTIAMLGSNEEIDIYEYDTNWVMTKYDTWVTYNGQTTNQSFYGYIKRSHVTCDPPLEGDSSDKHDTGPGKRKGRPKRPVVPGDSATPDPDDSSTPKPNQPQPTIPVEDMMEYDWIIRTPGVCQEVIDIQGIKFVAQFGLYAMKFGGYTASSQPVYNDGKSNPYVGYVTLSLKQKTQQYLDDNNLDFLQGFGGISIDAFNGNARFNIDAPIDNGTSTIITINVNAISVMDPKIIDDYMGIEVGGQMFTDQRVIPLDIKLQPGGGGYQFVVLQMRPGGGDLKFPAMLEKFPLDDITKAERERLKKEREKQKEKERLEKAKELQKKLLEDWKKELQEKFENEANSPDDNTGSDDDIPVVPLVPEDNDIPVVPLVPEDDAAGDDDIPVVPLVPEDDGSGDDDIPVVPLVPPDENSDSSDDDVTLAPLTGGGTSEEPDFFP